MIFLTKNVVWIHSSLSFSQKQIPILLLFTSTSWDPYTYDNFVLNFPSENTYINVLALRLEKFSDSRYTKRESSYLYAIEEVDSIKSSSWKLKKIRLELTKTPIALRMPAKRKLINEFLPRCLAYFFLTKKKIIFSNKRKKKDRLKKLKIKWAHYFPEIKVTATKKGWKQWVPLSENYAKIIRYLFSDGNTNGDETLSGQ